MYNTTLNSFRSSNQGVAMERRALIISSDQDTVSIIRTALEPLGCDITSKVRLSSGLKAVKGSELIVLDIPDENGIKALVEIKSYYPEAMVLATAASDCTARVYEEGAFCCLEKPLEPLKLKTTAQNALRYMALRQELGRLKSTESPEFVVGKNLKMLKVLKQIEKASAKDMPVLISGERGTGKGLVAKAVHFRSARRAGPFVTLTAPTGEELFGNIIPAEGGSILLKEVDKQVRTKLTGFLKDRKFSPRDGSEAIKADVRVICTTKDPDSEDPFYKSFNVHIKLPSLRERTEDIVPLTEHFLKKAEKLFQSGKGSLSKDARKSLLRHHWPGNVKELEDTVKRAYILSKNSQIEKYHLGLEGSSVYGSVKEFLEDKLKKYIKEMTKLGNSGLYDTVVSEVEKALIELVLKETDGNQLKTAKALGINRNTLRAKIKNYGIKNRGG